MSLRSFLVFLFGTLIVMILGANFNAYLNDKRIVLEYISDWSSSALVQTEGPISEHLSNGRISAIQKLLDKAVVSRPFIASLSLSLDGSSYTVSSDRSLQGEPLSPDYTAVTAGLGRLLFEDLLNFRLPVEYYRDGERRSAYLLLNLDRGYVFEEIFSRSVRSSLQVLGVAFLIFGGFFAVFYRLLILPINDLIAFVNERRETERRYVIDDFNRLSRIIRHSFTTLVSQKQRIQEALDTERHLESILQTVADINKLLVVSRSLDELLDQSCERLATHGDYRLSWIGYIRGEHIEITTRSQDPSGYLDTGLGITLSSEDPTSRGPAARSILENKTVIADRLLDDASLEPWRQRLEKSPFSALICLPLRPDNYSDPFGVLTIYTVNPEGFEEKEIRMLEELAGDIGFAADAFEKERRLHEFLTTDTLSGLPNRTMLLEALNHTATHELMLVDVDRFDEINEVYGFEVGDRFLTHFAESLRRFAAAYPKTELYSLGIDHFALLFKPGHRLDIPAFADALVSSLENEHYDCFGIRIMPTVTTGFAQSPAQTLEHAELALKQAKSEKRKLVIFDPSMLMVEAHRENMLWYNIVRHAIAEDRIIPYFQGIVDNRSGQTVKYECLMRLILPDGDVVAPAQFLEIAKKTRLYPDLTRIIATKAIRAVRDQPVQMSINISLEDILNEQVTALLKREIVQNGVGERIVFEILESEGIRDYERVAAFIRDFKTLGCKFAIDDFGSGYSNFEHLLKLQIDYLKIDGSLIQNIVHDQNAQVLVKHICSFAGDLNMLTIAEFVSSKAIYEKIREIGITYSQGYHFHHPSATMNHANPKE